MATMKKTVSVMLVVALLAVSACATYHYEGATAGGAVGGIAGALLDSSNPWRGGVIGAALGAVFGATMADVSARGAYQAATVQRPVSYRTTDGRAVYRAEPVHYDAKTKCTKVHERVWQDGQLVKDELKEVCRGEKYEPTY